MNMKSVFNTLLLGVGLLSISQEGFAQSQKTHSTEKNNHVAPSSVITCNLNNTKNIYYKYYNRVGLSSTATHSDNTTEEFSIHTPSRDALPLYDSKSYAGILVPVASMLAENPDFNIGMYGRDEYATVIVDKKKRHLLTDKLLNDFDELKKFINTKGNITEIDRGLNSEQVMEIYQQNKDHNIKTSFSKNADVAYILIGGG